MTIPDRFFQPLLAAILLTGLVACTKQAPASASTVEAPRPSPSELASPTTRPTNVYTIYSYEVVNSWSHDRSAFTQGLVFLNGLMLESTGLNGESSLRKVDLTTGKVIKKVEVPAEFFAEGIAVLSNKLYQLTWKHGKCFVYNLESFQIEKEFHYEGEGWGLTTDQRSLILSDGTEKIRFINPVDFQVRRSISVVRNGQPIQRLNELEFIKGEIFANLWGTDFVVRIDPESGRVNGVIDFTGLLPAVDQSGVDVLNGIAYDEREDRLFVTGKLWPKLFEVRLKVKR